MDDWHAQDTHLSDKETLKLASLSKGEAEALVEILGGEDASTYPYPEDANPAAVDFVMVWAASTLDKKGLKALIGSLKAYVESFPPETRNEPAPEGQEPVSDISKLPVGKKVLASLRDAGFLTLDDLRESDAEALTALPHIGEATAEKIMGALGA